MIKIITIFCLLIFFSISIRYTLIYSGQNWIKSYSQSVTLVFLPIITYALTSVISNNIALSLGLVGALSIVRFRHPVRSAMELTIYFLLISLGITAAANIKWSLFLGISSILILTIFGLIRKKNIQIFPVSFQEGNENNTLEINTNIKVDELRDNKHLIFFQNSNGKYFYRFASENKNSLFGIVDSLEAKKIDFEQTLHLL